MKIKTKRNLKGNHMEDLSLETLESKSILEMVEFIEERKEEVEKYIDIFSRYFEVMEERKVIPFYYFDFYTRIDDNINIYSIFRKQLKKTDISKIILPVDFQQKYDIKKLEEISYKYLGEPINFLIDFYVQNGFTLFLNELLEQNYFEKGKAQIKLNRLFDYIHPGRYSRSDDLLFPLVEFLEGKEDSVQMVLGELLFEFTYLGGDSYTIRDILLCAFKKGNKYIKKGVLKTINIVFQSTDDINEVKPILEKTVNEENWEDEEIRDLVILLIDEFPDIEEEIKEYLKEEKGIIYTSDMAYEVWYRKTKSISEELKKVMKKEDNEEK